MADTNLARRLKFLIGGYRRNGLGHVLEVFRQARVRHRYARSPQPLPDAEAFRSQFMLPGGPATFLEKFHRLASRRLPITATNRREFFLSLLSGTQSHESILDDAENFAEGRFPMLGLCIDEPDHRYDWHLDYASGRRYEPLPFNEIDFMGGDGSDVKYAWELSRWYWSAWLGKAYWVTSNGAWARDFARHADSWFAENPYGVGVNWSMPMEVAIRAFWMVMAYGFFHSAPGISSEWWEEYLRQLWGHGLYLQSNLEYFSNLTNHYVSNLLGLIAVGSMFADTPQGRRWLVDGRRRLIVELRRQTLADGVHYERSLAYHRLVLEFALASSILLDNALVPLPPDSRTIIERMSEFVLDYTHPGGAAPQLGDCDDGVLFRLRADQDLYDHRNTLALAGAYFERGDFRSVAGPISQDAILMLGGEGFERYRRATPQMPVRSVLYPAGGFAVLRSPRLHVVADVGPIGLHGNNDALSFTLATGGRAIVIDPGTYCYTRNATTRNELRASRAHNGPWPEELELAEFDGLWRVKNDAVGMEVERWSPGGHDHATHLVASHVAYQPAVPGSRVRRSWSLEDDALRVEDEVVGFGDRRCWVCVTIHPDFTVRPTTAGVEVVDDDGAAWLAIRAATVIEIESSWSSPSYGVARASARVLLRIPEEGRLCVDYLCPPSSHPA